MNFCIACGERISEQHTYCYDCADGVLRQIGWCRQDTLFVSLNLLPAEWDVLQRALFAAPLPPDNRTETQLTEILSQWLTAQETAHGNCNCNAAAETDRLAATA